MVDVGNVFENVGNTTRYRVYPRACCWRIDRKTIFLKMDKTTKTPMTSFQFDM